jgi:predicted flap endonuclease-1-like 5' DNA nuclease
MTHHERDADPAPHPTAATSDDLTRIKGIGPIIQEKLNEFGITRYRQLAVLHDEDLDRVNDAIGLASGRIHQLGWREQARLLLRK